MRQLTVKKSALSKVSLIFLAALICLAFVGCAGQQTTSETTPPDTAPPETAAPVTDGVYSSYVFTSQEQLISDTTFLEEELGYSPHDSHYGELTCELCHESAADGGSELWCTSCHVGLKLPAEGWTAAPLSDFPTSVD